MKRVHLDQAERAVERNARNMVPVSGRKRNRIEAILLRARKSKSISLRIASYDLSKIKEKALLGGMPYQTLITTVLHKYISDALYEKDEVLKVFKFLHKASA